MTMAPSRVVMVRRRSVSRVRCQCRGVEEVVVVFAQRDEEFDVGVAAVVPVDEVVWFGLGDVGVAAGDHASPVHGSQGAALVAGREPA